MERRRGGQEENRGYKCAVWRRLEKGIVSKKCCCTEPDYLKWKFLRRGSRDMVPFTVDRVRDRKMERGSAVWGREGKKKKEILKCDSNSINTFLNHYREAEWYLYEGLRTHLQLEMVSCLTQTLLHPNPCNYISYCTCVSTHVQH